MDEYFDIAFWNDLDMNHNFQPNLYHIQRKIHNAPMEYTNNNYTITNTLTEKNNEDHQHSITSQVDYIENPELQYQKIKQIGQGAFGTVYKSLDKLTNTIVVEKILSYDESRKPRAQNEIIVLQYLKEHLDCEKYICIHKSFYDKEGLLHIIMKYIDGKDLSKIPIQERRKLIDIQDILNKIQDLHSVGICHGDIKESNMMIDTNNQIHIIDFGGACIDNPCKVSYTPIYTLPLMATHVVQRIPATKELCEKHDMYSAGMIWAFLHMRKKDIYLFKKRIYDTFVEYKNNRNPNKYLQSMNSILYDMYEVIHPDEQVFFQYLVLQNL